jgi:hypothetical protein
VTVSIIRSSYVGARHRILKALKARGPEFANGFIDFAEVKLPDYGFTTDEKRIARITDFSPIEEAISKLTKARPAAGG